MKLTPLALAATLCAFTAHAQQDDDCPSDAQMIATMSFAELDRYEADMRNEEPSFEELCKDATDKDEEEAAGSRRHYCVKRTARYVSYNTDIGAEEYSDITMYDYAYLPRAGTTWTHRVRVDIRDVMGEASNGLTMAPFLYCGSCTEKQQFQTITIGGQGAYDFAATLGMDTEDGRTSQNTQLILTRFNVDQTPIEMSAPELRCERLANSQAACRHPDYPGVLELSLSDPDVDESAAHILAAQAALPNNIGRWDADASLRGKAITRVRSKEIRRANRNTSKALCEQRFTGQPAAGKDCDEYPFASTYQGASLVPEDQMSVRYLDSSDNRRVGGKLGEFYCGSDRIIDGEEFWLRIIP
ncbi:NucA/NucB deoxyribonuclease domain-containing protein [Stenotrophomonas maltophilia]|uniref:NucA/NucB deoxyribonuclease domain-containing protein n=1 Tax=Stenotrophomonas maltophilia TaxID=40324 RepID=UPI002894C7DF|nr:NucA/NucB deoxyribonuclease domain-containing protein [Stenotrophomonas maltophilia]MDT3501287.1 NucA/NucB deoxyribonuclease domain-containing protein [Stenotrophomonas maltophilia]